MEQPRTFDAAGTFRYYCDFHGAPGGQGMAGKIVVLEAGAPLPDTTKPVLGGVAPQAKTFGATKPVRILFGLSEPATVTGVPRAGAPARVARSAPSARSARLPRRAPTRST